MSRTLAIPALMVLTIASIGRCAETSTARPAQAVETSVKPNIIYFVIDDLGYYELSYMGNRELKTPNIDRMAAEGMRFTQFLAGSVACAPTRCCLMTGKHTGHTSIRANYGLEPLRPDEETLASLLKKAGYTCGGFGKWAMGNRGTSGIPEDHGFDVFFGYYDQNHAHSFFPRYLVRNSLEIPLEGNTGDYHQGKTFSQYLIVDEAKKFLRENKGRPFFLYLPWTPPHSEWGMPKDELLQPIQTGEIYDEKLLTKDRTVALGHPYRPSRPAAAPPPNFNPAARAAKHDIVMDKPAIGFFEGGLLGNGAMGVVVTTRPDAVVLHFGHNDVWDIRLAEENREKLLSFDEMWRRVKQGGPEFRAWFREYCQMAGANYAQPYPRPWPCGSLVLGFDRRKAELLGHRVRIAEGACEVKFLVGSRPATLVIMPEMARDRLWLKMVDVAGQSIASPFDRIRLIPEVGMETQTTSVRHGLPANRENLKSEMETTTASARDGLSFRQVLPFLRPNREKDKALRTTVRVTGQVTPRLFRPTGPFVACVALEHGPASSVPEGMGELPEPTVEAFDEAAAVSRRSWKAYWSRSGVALTDELLERTWYRNLYFLNCATRPGALCPGFWGNWSYANIGGGWHGDYHTNYNIQQTFWGTFSTNHVDKHLPYVDLVHFLLPISRGWARDYYQLPGACFPHSSYPVEMTLFPYPVPVWGGQVCETPWVVQSLWWHYLYTMDREFLHTRAFEPIKEAVLFLNAYMRRSDAHGPAWNDDKFHIYPTVVPELRGLSADRKLNADCIVDLALTRFVFHAYLEACRILELTRQEAGLVQDVQEVLQHFPPYPTAESRRGTVFVSVPGEDPEVVYNTPNSLMTVFPGEDHGLHSPPEIRKILANTWQNHRNEGLSYLVFLHLQGARLGLLDLEKFKRQINYCTLPNGTCTDLVLQVGGRYRDTTRFDWLAWEGIWCENFALPVVINECLLQSYHGELRPFPNWTKANGDARFQTLRAVGAFLVSAEYKDGRVRWVRVTSEAGQPLQMVNPWPGHVVVTRGSKKEVAEGELIKIPTRPGETLELTEQAGS